jgi:hypothetical protein
MAEDGAFPWQHWDLNSRPRAFSRFLDGVSCFAQAASGCDPPEDTGGHLQVSTPIIKATTVPSPPQNQPITSVFAECFCHPGPTYWGHRFPGCQESLATVERQSPLLWDRRTLLKMKGRRGHTCKKEKRGRCVPHSCRPLWLTAARKAGPPEHHELRELRGTVAHANPFPFSLGAAQAGLEIGILPPQPPRSWDYRRESPRAAERHGGGTDGRNNNYCVLALQRAPFKLSISSDSPNSPHGSVVTF